MIGIDTNILTRVFLLDDTKQSADAQKFLKQNADKENIFISSYAILEFAWVLKMKNYTRQQIYDAIIFLADTKGITISQRDVVVTAAGKYLLGKADFGNYMILADGQLNGASSLKTFDKKLLQEL